MEQALWLPREDQLRTALGEGFVSLEREPRGWVVSTVDGTFGHQDPEEAYAAALLASRRYVSDGPSSKS